MPSPKQLALTLALHAALFIVYGILFFFMVYCFVS